ncbi:glycosyltransferase [Pseudarthrobacter sp. J64]|uniref:glycosyltransferase n=1 Tax=unclassified Pseudarthrobacter TaxID=2647000 RepID=UPI002E807245|nr:MULTISPECIES: glycosyltransferase [unclassified Pseudarthrobacter]MEE2524055.1 glycosyltransferase [Pseudarthrobacter sp. J47]MEE2568498.1 glycosyltransferase [Pseudarthrobacter sp. J64]
MKHPDESVQTSAIQLAKRRLYAADIDKLIADYERLRGKESSASRKAKDLAKDLAAMRRARDSFKAKQEVLSRENQRLKETLSALRRSQSLKVGRMITKPASAVRSLPGKLASAFSIGQSEPSATLAALEANLPHQSRDRRQTATAPQKKPANQVDYSTLIQDFESQPSKGALYRLISHEYFVRGEIALPAERISDNQDLVKEMSAAEARVAGNILGQSAILKTSPFIAPRQPNYGYLPEHGRIMYCAHSTGQFNSNGYSTRTAGLVAGLKERGEDVFVVARPGYPWDAKTDVSAVGKRRFEKKVSGVRHVYNPGASWTEEPLDRYIGRSVDVFVREAQRSRASVIHAASNYVTALPALMAARRLGIPFVYEVRGLWEITELSDKHGWAESDRFKLAAGLEAFVAREADEVFAITAQVKAELVRRGVDPDRITLLPNSVDTAKFSPMPPLPGLRKKLGIPETSVLIGYAGSLVAYEGLADLMASMKLVGQQGINAHLLVVGDGKQLPELKNLAKDLQIEHLVTFTGRVPANSIPGYLSIFDIAPCPRRRLPVTEMVSPLKPLEAMASGKAVVVTDLAPLRDIAGEEQQRALLCEPENPASLADAIVRLAEDPELRIAQGRRARLWTLEYRTWARTGEVATAAHHRLQETKTRTAIPAARVRDLKIGIISDEFTFQGLAPEAQFVVMKPATWRTQLQGEPIDALIVESAWEGVEGLWNHKVGFYDDDQFATLRELLAHCNASGIPTIFWNKEDPVHFNRFRVTAKYFDHVFTTDAECIPKYWESAGSRLKTVSSLPFYAQPRLHNILPSTRDYEHSVSYAGSFYGQKYPKRSGELARILNAGKPHGLAIYDRQHLNPESPYHFPPELGPFVRGGLAYSDMVEAYKAHPVHINVNSVDDSPTMFSRRVMEVAASGGAVVSGTGRGVAEVLDGLVPVISSQAEAELLISEWMSNEDVRMRDAWLAYRHIHRGHTAAHRLAYVLRTAGLVVDAPEPPSYAVFTDNPSPEFMARMERQTVSPSMVFAPTETVEGVTPADDFMDAKGQAATARLAFIGTWSDVFDDRTIFEDLLTATTFGNWRSIGFAEGGSAQKGLGLAQYGSSDAGMPALQTTATEFDGADLSLRRSLLRVPEEAKAADATPVAKSILVAGHDLKFATAIVQELSRQGHRVVFDKWSDHNKHDEELSRRLLLEADVVFCEWGLGNALWYSRNKLPHQRMVTRVHSQEIFRPYLKDVSFHDVDKVIFVGQHIADIAVRDHNVPRSKLQVIPNPVDTDGEPASKTDETRFHLGLVGIVPAQKHLDRALDVLKGLRATDDRYRLFVKGKRPEDFPWMENRPEEMAYYQEQYARISDDPDLAGAVVFDPHGDDMADWYRKIGVVLSVSDFESFHLTLADGAVAGALPVSLAWPGADQIYPTAWLAEDVQEMIRKIVVTNISPDTWRQGSTEARSFVDAHFGKKDVLTALCGVILGTP